LNLSGDTADVKELGRDYSPVHAPTPRHPLAVWQSTLSVVANLYLDSI